MWGIGAIRVLRYNYSKQEQKRTTMPFEIGRTKTGGRKIRVQNKTTDTAREALHNAVEAIGGQERLAEWAKTNPDDFYRLYARLIPQELNHGGQHNNPIGLRDLGARLDALQAKQLMIKDKRAPIPACDLA